MMLDATAGFAAPLTDERLFGWHAGLFPTGWSGHSRITVGQWRPVGSGPMRVVSAGRFGREVVHFEAPAAERLPDEMTAFLDWFNGPSPDDPVVRAGLAHLWFVTIHPFDDGNRADRSRSRGDGVGVRGPVRPAVLQHVQSDHAGSEFLLFHTRINATEQP